MFQLINKDTIADVRKSQIVFLTITDSMRLDIKTSQEIELALEYTKIVRQLCEIVIDINFILDFSIVEIVIIKLRQALQIKN